MHSDDLDGFAVIEQVVAAADESAKDGAFEKDRRDLKRALPDHGFLYKLVEHQHEQELGTDMHCSAKLPNTEFRSQAYLGS